MNYMRSYFLPIFVSLVYLVLYVPIVILVVFSFNKNAITYNWLGFTTEWYTDLFSSEEAWDAFCNSFFVASLSVCLSILLGLLLIFFSNKERMKKLLLIFYGNLAIPEIVLAVGLLSLFSFFSVPLGASTLIAGHTLLGLGYVLPILYNRFAELDVSLIEAAYDLGATKKQAFFTVILPLLMPAVIAAGLLVFIISLDDFIISFFCAGATMQTLPLYIFAVIRSGASPMVNALSTVLLMVSSFCVLVFSFLQIRRMGAHK